MITNYQEQKVYLTSIVQVTPEDLNESAMEKGKIVDAYFFRLGQMYADRTVYNQDDVKNLKTGLMIDLEGEIANTSVALKGSKDITEFMKDTNTTKDDFSNAKGRNVTQYTKLFRGGIGTIGIKLKS